MPGLGACLDVVRRTWNYWKNELLVEPPIVRKRIKLALRSLVNVCWPKDASLKITVFVWSRREAPDDPELVPVVRYEHGRFEAFGVKTAIRFRPSGFKNPHQCICKAFTNTNGIDPGLFVKKTSKIVVSRLPRDEGKSRPAS